MKWCRRRGRPSPDDARSPRATDDRATGGAPVGAVRVAGGQARALQPVCRLKDWRRIATRYDKLATNFAAAVTLAAIVIWWL